MKLGEIEEKLSRKQKRWILIVLDFVMITSGLLICKFFLVPYIALDNQGFWMSFLTLTLVYFVLSYRLQIFSVINRYTDYRILSKVAFSILVAFGVLAVIGFVTNKVSSVRFLTLAFILIVSFVSAPRMIWRIWHEKLNHSNRNKGRIKRKRTLVFGAGDGGNLFINTIHSTPDSDIELIGILDSDKNKKGTVMHGVQVLGTEYDIPALVQQLGIDQITIAIPSLSPQNQERILEICNSENVAVNIMPSVEDVMVGNITVSKLRDIDIVDLLGRQEIKLPQDELSEYFKGKTILVTGAGGSIGSEICRQVSHFRPARFILLGHGENSIYLIHKELTNKYGNEIEYVPVIADVQDMERMRQVMETYHPQVVYHAAAHKHVPLMEYNPFEAVKNNIWGTRNVALAAKEAGVESFVMVSTDKAVNPPNVMGATKRVAEMIVTGLNESDKTRFAAVRFGNVLGSRGSVVPLFKEQIAKGGPVTVTDFRMTRYFMTIPEASRLVIQAGFLMKGGEIFVLDMGEPVKIIDLAQKVIKLSGHKVEEIGIVESGIRPGEKLYEELLSSEERVSEQVYDKIFLGRVTTKPQAEVDAFIETLSHLDRNQLKEALVEFAKQ